MMQNNVDKTFFEKLKMKGEILFVSINITALDTFCEYK